jgi:hypothetical protein
VIASKESLAERRQALSLEIARHRTELAQAYRDLAKPLEYTQKGIKGLQVVKQNAWAIALLPMAVRLGFSFFGWTKKDEAKKVAARVREEEVAAARKKPPLGKWLGRGVALFQLYRRVRPFLPL